MNRSGIKISATVFSLALLLGGGFFFVACDEEPIGIQPSHSGKPDPVSNVTYTSLPGGASLRYTIPDCEDLLYIKAVYTRNGEECESRASIYSDTLLVEGFGDTEPKRINIIAVDRSRNESDPYPIDIVPATPDVFTIAETMEITPDFGGIHIYWDNPNQREISVWLLIEDSINPGEYIPLETFYSSAVKGSVAKRGMDTIPVNIQVFAQDRWENRTEIRNLSITPIFETLFDYNLIIPFHLPGDGPHYNSNIYGSWGAKGLWNNSWGGDHGYSSAGGTGIWPQSLTTDLGQTGKISRLRVHQRMGNYTWKEGNPRKFEVWGRATITNYNDGSWDGWTKMGDFESIKPSGLPFGEYTAEDEAVARDGEDFVFDPSNPPVRFLRFLIKQTWAGGDNWQSSEFEIFGDNRSETF